MGKVPKKPLKIMEKPVEKLITKNKPKKKKKKPLNFSLYIYKVLKDMDEVQEKVTLSRKSMAIMNDFAIDMMEKLSAEAGTLTKFAKKQTMSSNDIQSAVRFLVPGELSKHANIEGIKAVTKYHNSLNK